MADNTEDVPPIPPAPAGPPPVEPAPVVAPPAAPPAAQIPAASPPPAPLPPLPPPAADARPNPYAQPHATPPAQGAPAYAPVPAGPPQGLALASLITGIGSVLLAFVGIGFLPAVAAVVLGHLAQRRQPYARALWITGLVTGYVGLGISLITGLVLLIAIIAGIASSTSYGY